MRSRLLIVAGLVMMMSCGLREIGGETDISDGVWSGPGAGIAAGGAGPAHKTVWYTTGFDYPDGYDWRSDPESGMVKCSLVVYANAVPMMKVPVGDDYQVSSDPDMHRIIEGELYTDYAADSMTVVKRNGKYVFSYPGREIIVAMHVDSSFVFTLGQSRNGQGFSYRKNGESVYEHKSGILLGSFENGRFAFYERVKDVSGNMLERYYLYDSGSVIQIAVREDIKRVWDIKVSDQGVAYLATLVGISSPVLVVDGLLTALEVPSGVTVRSCRFVQGQKGTVVEGVYFTQTGVMTSVIWRDGIREYVFPSGQTVLALCSWEDGVCCVLKDQNTGRCSISRYGEIIQIPEGYVVMGACPLAVVDGILHVGLTSLSGKSPLIWKDGETKPLKHNGYIASIVAE